MSSVTGLDDLHNRIKSAQSLVVVHFSAEWAPQCAQVRLILEELSKLAEYSKVVFLQVDVDAQANVVENFKVEIAPTLLFFWKGELHKRLTGCDPSEIKKQLEPYLSMPVVTAPAQNSDQSDSVSVEYLKQLLSQRRVMLFMKGSPEAPRCGFSRQIVQIIQQYTTDFGTFDILANEAVRQSLKKYSNWPTYPQLYVDGQLIGGLDVVREMKESEESEFRQLLCGK